MPSPQMKATCLCKGRGCLKKGKCLRQGVRMHKEVNGRRAKELLEWKPLIVHILGLPAPDTGYIRLASVVAARPLPRVTTEVY